MYAKALPECVKVGTNYFRFFRLSYSLIRYFLIYSLLVLNCILSRPSSFFKKLSIMSQTYNECSQRHSGVLS